MFSDISIREAFHVSLLRRLSPAPGAARWRLKGGINLRLFFGSSRYSETAFRGKVLESLEESVQAYYRSRWEDLQLSTAELIDTIRRAPAPGGS